MAGEGKKPRWVKFPSDLLRALARQTIPGRHRRTLDALVVLTWDYGKKRDQIASSQVAELTGFSAGQVRETLRDLLAWGIVTRTTGGPRVAATWAIQENPAAWEIGKTEAGQRARVRKAKVPKAPPAELPALSSGRTSGSQAAEPPAGETAELPAEIAAELPATPIEEKSPPSLRSGERPPLKAPDPDPPTSAEAKVLELVPPGEPAQGVLIQVESLPEKLVDFFVERRLIALPHTHAPTPAARKTWVLEMERLLRIGSPGQREGPPPDAREIAETIWWLFEVREPTDSSTFWRRNVESVPKFRIKYHERLRTEILAEKEAAQRADQRRARSEAGTLQEGADLVRRIVQRPGAKS